MFLFLIIVLLSGCISSERLYPEAELKELAEDNLKNNRYKLAGEKYFALWCQYPQNNPNALLDASQAYSKAGEYAKALELMDDFIIMKGDAGGKVYKWKALIYLNMVKSPLKNLDKAEKALINLKMYKKINPKDASNSKELLDAEVFLNSILVAAKMLNADLAVRANPPSFIYALKAAGEVIEEYPDSQYTKHAKAIYNNSLENLGVSVQD